ncbi:MAG: type VI secretion system ATPase TssH, partial [Chloroflexales bacterium]|nr:type VI secretion system ATPase TssH [Chloroflexales bacterium]
MSMNTNRFTEKSQEAVESAVATAQRNANAQVEPEHLLLALLNQTDGVVPQVLSKLNIAVGALIRQATDELNRLARVHGDSLQVVASSRLQNVIRRAYDELGQFGDEFVSTEHLLLSLLANAGAAAQRILQQGGLTRDNLLAALREVRGTQRVTSPTPEGTYAALDQYGRNLTDLARRGKLDPV